MSTFKYRLSNGRDAWGYVYDLPGSTRENRKQVKRRGFATKREAAEAERIARTQQAQADAPPAFTLARLLEDWLTEHAERNLAAKTVERYKEMRAYLSTALLDRPVTEITALDCEREWHRLQDSGGIGRRAGKPLSAKTVRNIAGMVCAAMSKAVKWQVLQTNPCALSDKPTAQPRRKRALTSAEQSLLLSAIAHHEFLGPYLALAAATGARRGELLALQWSNLDGARLTIQRSLAQTKAGLSEKGTKTGRVRVVTLPAATVALLETHRLRQAEYRRQFGPDYHGDLIFGNPDGTPKRPDSVSAAVSLLCDKLNIHDASLHSLRHTHASYLLADGVDIAAVSARLGHESSWTTARIYAHALPERDQEIADRWQRIAEQVTEKGKVQ